MSTIQDKDADKTAPMVGAQPHHAKHWIGASLVALVPEDLYGVNCTFRSAGAALEFGFVVQLKSAAAPSAWTYRAVSTWLVPGTGVGLFLPIDNQGVRFKVPAPKNDLYCVYLVYAGASASAELYVAPTEGIGAY